MSDMERYKHDCVGFCRDILGLEPTFPSDRIMQALARETQAFNSLSISVSELGVRFDLAFESLRMLKQGIESAAKVEQQSRAEMTKLRGRVQPMLDLSMRTPKPFTWEPGMRLVLHKGTDPCYSTHQVTPSFMPSKPQQVWFEDAKPSSSGRTLVQGLLTGGMQ